MLPFVAVVAHQVNTALGFFYFKFTPDAPCREFKVGDPVKVKIEATEDRFEDTIVGTILECMPDGTYKVRNPVDSRPPKIYRASQLSNYVPLSKRKRISPQVEPVEGPQVGPQVESVEGPQVEPVESSVKQLAWVKMAEQHLTTNGSQFSFKIKYGDKVFRNNHGAYDNLDTV